MSPTEPPFLCVSIHDVAPATWHACERLARAIREVADIPLTWLVVPRYHEQDEAAPGYHDGGGAPHDRGRDAVSGMMEAGLSERVAQGHELALHGYTHLDSMPVRGGLASRFLRGVYTTREGEFSALPLREAERRLRLGLDWFAARGWPVHGFVAPAWLLGTEAWQAVRAFPFEYTTTFSRFHLLDRGTSVWSPSLVYAARNRAGRFFSPLAADAGAALLARAPLVRLSLHPADARHPRLLAHAQRTLQRLLVHRTAVTKVACARRLVSTLPSSRGASIPDRSTTGS